MFLKKRSNQKFAAQLFIGALIWGGALSVSAAIQELTATFQPDSQNPMNNKFTNTTPQSGICPWHIPATCLSLGIFSIRTYDIVFRSNGPLLLNPGSPTDPRKGVMFKVPSEWRSLEVLSDAGDRETVEMRIAGIGNRVDVGPPVSVHSWSPRSWRFAPAPCQSSGYATGTNTYMLWFWLVPQAAGACNLIHVNEVPSMYYSTFEYAYELRTPNPLNMRAGTYRGSLVYSVGPYKDFDWGDIMIPNDDTLVFNFTLDVTHILKVEIPPGGNRVELVPQGGWQSWVQQGRRPTRLFRDQTFNLWTSSRFKMLLQCQFPSGNTCAMQSETGQSVPLDISVSLPYGIGDEMHQTVLRRPLLLDGSTTRDFVPTQYVDRRPGTLHFEVPASEVEQMFKPGAPGKYSGTATVIWDSEV